MEVKTNRDGKKEGQLEGREEAALNHKRAHLGLADKQLHGSWACNSYTIFAGI